MSMIDIAYALTAPLEAMMFFLLFDTFFERRKAFARWQFVAGVVTLAVLIRIVNIAFMFRVGNLLGIILAAIVVSAVFYRSTWYQRLLVPILTGSIFSAIEIIVMNLILVVFDVTAVEVVSIPAYLMMGVVLSKAIGFAVCYAIRMRKSIIQVALGAAYWLLFLFLFVSSVLASFLIFWMLYALNDTRYNGPALICTIGLYVGTFLALHLYARSQEQNQIIRYQEQAEQQMRAQLRHMDEVILKQNELRAMRHDMNSHLIALKGYFDARDDEGGSRYIEGLGAQFQQTRLSVDTGNSALDALLSAKQSLAAQKGIVLYTDISIGQQFVLSPEDACIVFGNALDNAIEACERLPAGTEKRIDLVLKQDAHSVFCKITNTAPPRADSTFATSKADKADHGFGLNNIRAVLDRYDCMPVIAQEGTTFSLSFILFS